VVYRSGSRSLEICARFAIAIAIKGKLRVSRRLFINIHLYLSAFFAGVVVLMALSGGLYLLDIKGENAQSVVAVIDGGAALLSDPTKEAVSAAIARAGVSGFDFDYVRTSGSKVYTRPTSATNYVLEVVDDSITVTRQVPDLQKRMIELHKGHGPTLFRTFEKVFAAGMVFIILSGVWLGLSAERLRKPTLLAAGSGLMVFLGLAFL
jgi:hypothetical protein